MSLTDRLVYRLAIIRRVPTRDLLGQLARDEYGQLILEDAVLSTRDGLLYPKADRSITADAAAGFDYGDHEVLFAYPEDVAVGDAIRFADDDGRLYEVLRVREYPAGPSPSVVVDARLTGRQLTEVSGS